MRTGRTNDPNAIQAGPDWPAVVVAGAYQTGVVLMRDLSRHGLEVHAVEWFTEQPGFLTVYGKTHLCPHPDNEPEKWRDFMVALGKTFPRPPVLIPSSDQFVSAIEAHADALAEHFVFSRAGVTVQALLATKRRQYDIADRHGMCVPLTRLAASETNAETMVATETNTASSRMFSLRLMRNV